jgi:hypothetical protein
MKKFCHLGAFCSLPSRSPFSVTLGNRTLRRVCGVSKRHRLREYLSKATATGSCACSWLFLGFSTEAFM